MNSDRFLGQEDEGKDSPVSATGDAKTQPLEAAGATGLFGVMPGAATSSEPGDAPLRSQPVVHSVVFKSDSSRAEGTDQLLNILRSPALKADAMPPPTASPVPVLPPPAASGGFTQLLRALNYEQQPKDAATPDRARAIENTPAAAARPQALPASEPQVTSFRTQPSVGTSSGSFTQLFASAPSEEPLKVEAAPAAPGPGSFTQMFRALDAAPVEPAKPESRQAAPTSVAEPVVPYASAPGSFTQMLNPPAAQTASVESQPVAPTTGPGSFTQMFAAVSSPTVEPLSVAVPPVIAPAPDLSRATEAASTPGSFTQMFRALDAAPAEAVKDPAPAALPNPTHPAAFPVSSPTAPGSFTQMFRTLDAEPPKPSNSEAAQKATPVSPITEPGSFTQMFRALDAPAETLRSEPAAHLAAGAPESVATGPGSFTQMFSSPAAPMEATPAESRGSAASAPGSFTQMFRALDAAPVPASPPNSPGGPPNSDASQVFAAQPRPQPQSEPARPAPSFPPFESVLPSQARPTSAPSTNASPSGLTQLLRALDQPAQTPSRPYTPPAATPSVGGDQGPGAFTAMYGTLREEAPQTPSVSPTGQPDPLPQGTATPGAGRDATQAFRMPPAGAFPQQTVPLESGPSEFTRILNASVLRESALRGEGPQGAVETPVASPPSASPAAPAWAMPQAPKMAPVPQMPHTPQPPQIPKLPEVKLPEVPKGPAASGMQQYLPLLLIIVIFLLIAVLVAVVFLMKR